MPLPFAFEDYEFDITELEAVQRLGGALDTAYTEEAQRSVAETFENWLVNGAAEFSVDGNTIYGYRTHPNRVANGYRTHPSRVSKAAPPGRRLMAFIPRFSACIPTCSPSDGLVPMACISM